jgi:hypothetical protein
MLKQKNFLSRLLNFIAWLTGVIVSLAVGFSMIDKVLIIRWIPVIITQITGWIVVVITLLGVIFSILNNH